MIKKNINPNTPIAIGIQSGDNTHHHDHVITLHSLSTMNAIVKRLGKLPKVNTNFIIVNYILIRL